MYWRLFPSSKGLLVDFARNLLGISLRGFSRGKGFIRFCRCGCDVLSGWNEEVLPLEGTESLESSLLMRKGGSGTAGVCEWISECECGPSKQKTAATMSTIITNSVAPPRMLFSILWGWNVSSEREVTHTVTHSLNIYQLVIDFIVRAIMYQHHVSGHQWAVGCRSVGASRCGTTTELRP
jgi:hypothetical protein